MDCRPDGWPPADLRCPRYGQLIDDDDLARRLAIGARHDDQATLGSKHADQLRLEALQRSLADQEDQ